MSRRGMTAGGCAGPPHRAGSAHHREEIPVRKILLLSALLFAHLPALAADETYAVIVGGNRVGHVKVAIDGDTRTIDYDVKNNGRGPTIAETLRLGDDGLPVAWTITGATTFGSKVDETFERRGARARWKDSAGAGEARVEGTTVYVGQSASPWALGLYARALRADEDRKLPALPGGELMLGEGEALEVGTGDARITVRVNVLSGLNFDPSYLLLDETGALFAVISARGTTVRAGYEAEDERLRELAARLSRERHEELQRKTAKRFDAPVRITNVRIFDPATMALTGPHSVVVRGHRIAGVQPADAPATPGEVSIDGEGGTLVPGLYEMHAHTGQGGTLLNVAAGVTSSRDMGNDNAVLDALIDAIEAGKVAGPRIARSGFIEGRSPFNSNNGILVGSEAEALDAVRWYAARGFHQVKLYNSMNPKWSAAAVAEAHRLGLRATGHVPAFSNADAMIEAGYDELTHINQIMLGWVLGPEEDTRTLLRLTALRRLATLDLQSPKVRRTLDLIVERKVAVEPTIAIHENLLLNQSGEIPRGVADIFDHMPPEWQRSARQAWTDMSAPGDREAYAGAWKALLATVREMRERGVFLIPGTDLGGALAYHRELMLFAEIGFTPAETLRRATLDMAAYLGQDQELGSIARGKLADFFLVPGDPTKDLGELRRIRMVVKDGTVYFPAEVYPHFGIKPFASAPVVTGP
jgi:imidazolonepropionase-like amidohydrolase